MKVLLLHIPQITSTKREIMVMPMGMFSIADYLNKNDIYTRILHLGIQKEIEKNFDIIGFIKENNYRIICVDIHWIKQTKQTIEYIKLIKQNIPDSIIITGGITATYFANELLKYIPEIDFVIRGEGEYPLLKLLKSLNNRKLQSESLFDIPNLSFRHNNKIYHNKKSFFTDSKFYNNISHSNFKLLYNYPYYFNQMLYADFDITKPLGVRDSYKNVFFYNPGKGCPYQCIYCGSFFYKNKYLKHSKKYYFFNINKAINDINNATNYGIDTLRVSFDPEPRREYYRKLFSYLPKKRLRLIFDCFTLPNKPFVESIAEYFRNDSVIVLSIETGSNLIRKKIKRPYFTNDELIECVEVLLRYRLNIHVFLSFGLPFETIGNYEDTLKLVNRLKNYKNIGITMCPITIDIGSQIYEHPSKYHIVPLRNSFLDWINSEVIDFRTYFNTNLLTEEKILEIIKTIQSQI